MMKRRVIAGVAGVLLLVAGIGTASAQTSPTVPETTTTSVLGASTTNTTTTTTTTQATTSTTTTEAPIVEPDEVVPTTQPPAVKGDVVSRPLPRTGNDIGGTALFGGALTVLGIALALGARKRRNSFDGA